jgi:3-hydroxyisobutyrate dehydrogenase-like beta-hydroxyacid dehydrogenase
VDVMVTAHRLADDVSIAVRSFCSSRKKRGSTCNMMQKDMLLAMELGRKLNVPVPTTAVSNEFLTAARGMGWEKLDFAVVFDVLARMSGVKK